jgi:fructose transport system ATP-binding protein
MPQVWEVTDRVHVQRLGKRIAVIDPKQVSSSDGVAIMTGALSPAQVASGQG